MLKIAREKLKNIFGYDSFRPQQEAIIHHVLEKKDTIVLMPTGGGKSICFQIPALVNEGTTLVISPLISLMKDQVEALKSNGVEAAFFNSSQLEEEKRRIIQKTKKGDYKLLYMAPETLLSIKNGWLSHVNIQLVAIDEAHCVSMWGHDFRPEYTQLASLREVWQNVPFVALTATADKATRKEIETKLGLQNAKTFLASFDRPNLSLNVRGNLKKRKKQEEVLRFIKSKPEESGIIYCLSRKETEEWSSFLNENGIKSKFYHAGLSSEERSKVQEDFINDEVSIITATIAFGMGIDKSNIRWIIHNNLPKNIEGYYQEIGRAGRDGLPSETRLYYNMRDVKMLADFARDSEQSDVLIQKLNRMLQYAESPTCRRKTLLSYFSETLEKDCGNCDICNNPPAFFDGTIIAQMALSGIKRAQEKIGVNLLIQLLRGAKTGDIYEHNFQKLKTYGVGKDYSFEEWRHFIAQLLNLGLLEIAYDENFNLKVTPFGEKVLFGKLKIDLSKYEAPKQKEEKEKKQKVSSKEEADDLLFEALRKLRSQLAKKDNMPAYIVFSDAALRDMAAKKPVNEEEFLEISGVGQQKLATYGKLFLEEIAKYSLQNIKYKGSTYDLTFEMFESGLSPEEIAQKRKMHQNTILAHLLRLYQDGKEIPVSNFVSDYEIDAVKKAVEAVGSDKGLKPIFEYLEEQIDYHKIKFALAYLNK